MPRWVKFLLSCFTNKGEEVVDIYIRWQMSGKQFNEGDIYTLRWDSIFYTELASAWTETIFEKSDDLIIDWKSLKKEEKEDVISDVIPLMRKNFVRHVIRSTRPEFDEEPTGQLINQSDIDEFYQQVVRPKIWDDASVNKNSWILATYNILCTADWYLNNDGVVEIEQDHWFDFNDDNLPFLKEFELLEKEARKRVTPKQYHVYIDLMDLTALKKNLKDAMGNPFIPKGWQSELLLFMGRLNYVVSCRGAGKTFVISYLIRRQLMLPNQLIGVLLPDKNNYARPLFRFMKPSLKASDGFKASMAGSNISIKNELLDSEVIFFPGNKDPDSSRGNTLDMLVIEEADFVIGKAVDAAKPTISRSNLGTLFAITTVWAVKRSWYYTDLISAELQVKMNNPDYYAKRVTIHQNPFLVESERKRLLEVERPKNPLAFDREWMCSFATEDSFDTSQFWIIDNEPLIQATPDWFQFFLANSIKDWGIWYFEKYILSYDIGKNLHKPGISLLWTHPDGSIHVVLAQYIEWSYFRQADLIKHLYNFLTRNWTQNNLVVIIDYLWVWVAVSEILENHANVPHIKMENGGKNYGKDQMIEWRYKYSKDRYMNKMRGWMTMGIIKWYSFMFDLMVELEWYDGDDEITGKTSWWLTHHFDILMSLVAWAWFAWTNGLFREVVKTPTQIATEAFYWNEDGILPEIIQNHMAALEEQDGTYSWYVPRR